jgi:hypothetical protein
VVYASVSARRWPVGDAVRPVRGLPRWPSNDGLEGNAEELRLHELPTIGFTDYLTSGHFISAVFENWESEFLQMAVYVLLVLGIYLRERGSPGSKPGAAPHAMIRH